MPRKNEKLGVLTVGMGAVTTTLMGGVHAVRNGWGKPIGALTQMKPFSELPLGLAELDDLVFAGWDIFPDNAYEAAQKAAVLDETLLKKMKPSLVSHKPMNGVYDPAYLPSLKGTHIKREKSKWALLQAVRNDIRTFLRKNKLSRAVLVLSHSVESYRPQNRALSTFDGFMRALKKNHPGIPPSMIYSAAAFLECVPVINATPNNWGGMDLLSDMSAMSNIPFVGCDLKTGQTFLKSVIAPALRKRCLGVSGWFSTNILGNRDGFVLDDPQAFRSKERSKKAVLNDIFNPKEMPDLYGQFHHKVEINYYPPRGDNKEGWDNIDLFGWLGYPMQIKVNFLCRDSILAAPLVLDLVLLMDWAHRNGRSGPQDWLGFYFKSPVGSSTGKSSHDLSDQYARLEKLLTSSAGKLL